MIAALITIFLPLNLRATSPRIPGFLQRVGASMMVVASGFD